MRTLLAVLALALALPLLADVDRAKDDRAKDDRAKKEKLVAEAVGLANVRELTELNLRLLSDRWGDEDDEVIRRVLTRLDYAKLGDEVYGSVFRDNFSTAELEQVVAFYRSKAGQKAAKIYPSLVQFVTSVPSPYLFETISQVRREMDKESAKERPDLAVMKDLRIIATCLEARATDENSYPVVAFDALPPLLEPVYVRVLPRVDPWDTPYFYVSDGQNYRIVSAGADRRFDSASRVLETGEREPTPTDDPDADIIFQNGTFRQFPRTGAPRD
jgi:hypothetical protein